MIKRTAVLLYGAIGYLLGVASLLYLIAFLFNLAVPKTIDSWSSAGGLAAALVDLALIALFGLQHSVMARRGFKTRLARVLPPAAERSTYMLATALVIFALCLAWQSLPGVVWQAGQPLLRHGLVAVGLAGWALVLVSTFLIDHFDLFGLRQVWLHYTGRDYKPLPFKAVGLYRYVRHPIMTGVLIGVWVTPSMTTGHLLFALGMTAYVLVGVHHEEADLVRAFGARYRQYMRSTGRFLPVSARPPSPSGPDAAHEAANASSATRAAPESRVAGADLARSPNPRVRGQAPT